MYTIIYQHKTRKDLDRFKFMLSIGDSDIDYYLDDGRFFEFIFVKEI
jgi:hypothetical protein